MSTRSAPEPVAIVKERRDEGLAALVAAVPYIQFLGVGFDRRGDELTAIMPYQEKLIGNPRLPALHGGATAAFLEIAAIIELSWALAWDRMEQPEHGPDDLAKPLLPRLPKTIDFSIDYLRSGLPRDAYARGQVVRSGRRFASVKVSAWQDNRERPFAMATGHFLMPKDV